MELRMKASSTIYVVMVITLVLLALYVYFRYRRRAAVVLVVSKDIYISIYRDNELVTKLGLVIQLKFLLLEDFTELPKCDAVVFCDIDNDMSSRSVPSFVATLRTLESVIETQVAPALHVKNMLTSARYKIAA